MYFEDHECSVYAKTLQKLPILQQYILLICNAVILNKSSIKCFCLFVKIWIVTKQFQIVHYVLGTEFVYCSVS